VNSSDKRIRAKYNKEIQVQEEMIAEEFRKNKISIINLQTDKPYAPELRKFFKFRIRMKNQR